MKAFQYSMRHCRLAAACCAGLLLVTTLCGCVRNGGNAEELPPLVTADELDAQLRDNAEFIEVARSGRLALSVRGTTAEVMVQDHATGEVWYSNPQDRDPADTAAQNKQLGSQFDFWIYDENQTLTNKNSQSDAVDFHQVSYARLDNGLRVTYVVGKKPTVFVVPEAVPVERFEQEILAGLDGEAREYVEHRYELTVLDEIKSDVLREEKLKRFPALADQPLYLLSDNLADFVKERLQEYILSSGYTADDLAADRLASGAEPEPEPPVVTVPLEYRLEDDSLTVTLNTAYMKAPEDTHISEISLLRYFGAAGAEAEGYILLPDGSGSLIELNNGKTHLTPLKIPVYGDDLSKSFDQKPAASLAASLPVYGLKHADKAFLAVIESGDPVASLEAGVQGQVNAYNYVYSSFELTQQASIASPYEHENDMLLFQEEPFTKEIRLRYFFLTGDAANYTGMARRYQRYLLDTGALQPAADRTPQLCLDLVGLATYPDTFLGVPVDKQQTLTTLAQAQEIVDRLHEAGVGGVTVNYTAWANGGDSTGVMDTLKPEKALGAADGLRTLKEGLESAGDRLFVSLDLQYVRRNTLFDSYVSLWHAPKSILGERTGKKQFSAATLEPEGWLDTLSPARYAYMAEHAQKSAAGLGLDGINLTGLAHDLYADFDRQNPLDRQDAQRLVREAVGLFSEKGHPLMAETPNAYALAGVQQVTRLPETSSGYYLCDRSVPFYQTVLHGIIPYAGTPLNLAGDYRQGLLQAAETGSGLLFMWMYEPNHVLFKTDTQYYSLSYAAWLETAAADWQRLAELLTLVQDSRIAGHEQLSQTLSRTTYDNGVAVYVNYGTQAVSAGGITIDAGSFAVLEGEA